MDVGCFQIGCRVNGDQEKEQGNHQQGKQPFRGYRKIIRKIRGRAAGPDHHGEDQVNSTGDTSRHLPDSWERKKAAPVRWGIRKTISTMKWSHLFL
jgi:hypothetical protein